MGKYICEFCASEFTKPNNLTKHQRFAKYCKKLQDEKIAQEAMLTCENCHKLLSRTDSLARHQASCIEYLVDQRLEPYQKEIDDLKQRLTEKERQLWELTNKAIDKPNNNYTHINSVTINNRLDLDTQIPQQEISGGDPIMFTKDLSKLQHEIVNSSFTDNKARKQLLLDN